MSFAAVLAAMPDLLARALAEHVPDDRRRCRECRSDDGTSAPWPCAMWLIADEARAMPARRPAGPPPASRYSDTAPGPVVPGPIMPNPIMAPQMMDEPITAPQPPISDAWDPLADRRAYRRERFHDE